MLELQHTLKKNANEILMRCYIYQAMPAQVQSKKHCTVEQVTNTIRKRC